MPVAPVKKPEGVPPSSEPGTFPSLRSLVRSARHGSTSLMRCSFVYLPPGAMLTAGGSKSPADLMAMVGVDLKSEAFWLGGFDAMEKLVSEFERLWAEYQQ